MDREVFFVAEEEEGTRLDLYISQQYEDLSRSYIQKLIKDQLVKVNTKYEKNKYIVKEGDEIEVLVPPPRALDVKPQNIPIDIVYEDEDVIIVNKPQDMVVHPAVGNYENTLVNALLYHCEGKLSSINGIIRPGIVHRIDKDTSGLLMVAKNNVAHRELAEQLKEHSITRRYHAIVLGNIKENKATIDAPIGRHPTQRLKMAVVENGRNAITHIQVLEKFKGYTYIEAKLETGRTHQIRVHLSYIKHPLLGDEVYGGKTTKFNLVGQVLHAKVLGFIHPSKKEYMEFEAPLPSSFEKVLRFMRSNAL
ncbi:RluA family pseudouridine synthase [Clostridium formicaceticum]|uniref:Pseudouridine synthase n=1 Tax=Clostridium formicaceticum TaxID=1497 RepID=A0AAC9WHQ3_9CLOT|nr:RluA family pseudouridine synthase [Clostridium formicaceticum]AOY77380.1 RNA pseudouridine synthase [Clostridium formicaceticum]ARE87930.1 Ribosomal large subunit pseudouridine synthase D [Clostridium formicaceticum]